MKKLSEKQSRQMSDVKGVWESSKAEHGVVERSAIQRAGVALSKMGTANKASKKTH